MNITEFSKIAGVSKSAVSRYFNDGYLSEDKKQLIEEAIKKTGYKPNIQAQMVRTRITKLIGVIIPKLSSESCARVVEGITEILNEEGYQVLLFHTNNQHHKEVEYLELLKQNRVDGVIFLATILTDLHTKTLKQMKVPVVIVGQRFKGYTCVCHDDYGAAFALTNLLIEKKCSEIAYLGVTKEDKAAGQAREDGFLEALDFHNLKPHSIYQAEFNIESGFNQMTKILDKKEKPDSLFCATDTIALGAMRYCFDYNIKIPKDLKIVSIGNTKMGEFLPVPMTTAHLYYKTSGRKAARLLLDANKDKDYVPTTIELDYKIIERNST